MQVQIRHSPSFAMARLLLAGAEPARVAAGAMVASSFGVLVEVRSTGGLRKSLRGGLGGDVPTASTFTAPQQGGWVDVAPRLPGDLNVVELDGTVGWCVAKGSWLASAAGVNLETQWAGFHNLFGGEGGFLMHATGHGPTLIACHGALDVVSLQPNELVTVDTGHVVGYPDTVQARIRPITPGITQSLKTGDGLVFDFAGPGQVITQSRSPRALLGWLQASGIGGRG